MALRESWQAGKSMEILALNGGFHGKTSWKPMENPWKENPRFHGIFHDFQWIFHDFPLLFDLDLITRG